MKAKRILNVLGSVDDQYIAEMYEEQKAEPKRRPVKKVWLIAAIVAVMLLLVGCVAYVLSLNDLKLRDDRYTALEMESDKFNTVSLQGFMGTPSYQAAQEWLDFEASYDPDGEIRQSLSNEEMIMPDEYWSYNCYTPEMTAKVDEICEKYGLNKQGPIVTGQSLEQFYETLKIDGILRENVEAEVEISPQYLYKTGTFMLSCETKLTGEDSPWNYSIEYSLYSVMKTDFDDVFLNVGDIETYDQSEYTTWNGMQVLLARSSDKALVFVDNGTAFISINIKNPRGGDEVYGEQMMPWEALEAFADTFDFSFEPQPVGDAEWEALQERPEPEEHEEALNSIGGESYVGLVQYLLENASRPEMLGYALLDIDGDGAEELLIARGQHICCIYTMEGDLTANLLEYPVGRYIYSFLWEEDGMYTSPSPMYLCEGNAVACIYKDLNTNRVIYHFAVPVDGEMVWKEEIAWEQNKADASYYEYTMEEGSNKGYNDICTPISEERYNEILSSYVRVKLEWTPLSEYPMD